MAQRGQKYAPLTGVMRENELERSAQSLVALPQHAKKPEGQADIHCWAQHVRAGCEGVQFVKQSWEDGKPVQQWCPHCEVGCSEEASHLKAIPFGGQT